MGLRQTIKLANWRFGRRVEERVVRLVVQRWCRPLLTVLLIQNPRNCATHDVENEPEIK